jgi:DNA-binding response OmpR family regulator
MLTGNAIILIVDTPESRSVLKRDLVELGYTFIVEASDMDEAMVKIEESSSSGKPVTLMLWAWTPGANQSSCVISKFRSSTFLKAIPIIMLVDQKELSRGLVSASQYINGYVVKPHTLEVLKSSLPMALANLL